MKLVKTFPSLCETPWGKYVRKNAQKLQTKIYYRNYIGKKKNCNRASFFSIALLLYFPTCCAKIYRKT